jgi:hypothetical protein
VDPFLNLRAGVRRFASLLCLIALITACHPGPIANGGAKPPATGGTIAGTVRADGGVSLAGRKVTATNEATGAKFDATSGSNGGYTIQVPPGTYRVDVELQSGETLSRRPDPTKVNVGDLDADRNFVLTVRK